MNPSDLMLDALRGKRMANRRTKIGKTEIKKLLIKNKNNIRKFGVKRIGLFGSVIYSRQKTGSDIDILVEFDKGNEKYNNLINLYFFLQKLFGKRIDLVTPNSISPYIAPYILKEVEYIEELS